METENIKIGLRVKIVKLEDTKGMFISKKHLDARKTGIFGHIVGWVPGHGGDVWWIKHDDDNVGAYCFTEFEPI